MTDDPIGGFAFGVPLPVPPALAELLRKGVDQTQMTAESLAAQVERFVSGLDVDGLMALRIMLNTGDMGKSLTAQFFDGQLVAILRYVHHVDPDSGKDPLATGE